MQGGEGETSFYIDVEMGAPHSQIGAWFGVQWVLVEELELHFQVFGPL